MDKVTEKQNPKSKNLEFLSTDNILYLMNDEDSSISKNVRKNIPIITKFVNESVLRIKDGGRMFYVGCGTSGRLGVLDASECPPTFSVDSSLIQGIIAGGNKALTKSVENAEDSIEEGKNIILKNNISSKDIVIGITASGSAKFVLGALSISKKKNALTALITFNELKKIKYVDCIISTIVGPEIISGSTRLKAGTATKMILNMISTATMIKLNKVYKNLMIDLKISNDKLQNRAVNIISKLTSENISKSEKLLSQSKGNLKSAILMYKLKITYSKSLKLIKQYNGNISKILRDNLKC